MSVNEIQLITGVEPAAILAYIGHLMASGYVRFAGLRCADSGEAIPLFQLRLRQGPLAPFVDDRGELVDPNKTLFLHSGMRDGERQKRRDAPRKPSLAARMRVAAERLGAFTREDLRAAVFGQHPSPIECRWFGVAFGQMLLRGQVQPDGNGGFTLVQGFDPVVDAIREKLRGALERPLPAHELEQTLGFMPSGPQMRSAVDLLKAERYEVTRTSGPGKGHYVVQRLSDEENQGETNLQPANNRGVIETQRTQNNELPALYRSSPNMSRGLL
jgi:hypothetical protein